MIQNVKLTSSLALLIAVVGTVCAPLTASAACDATTIARTYGFRFDGFVTPAKQLPQKISAFYPEVVAGEISFTATSASEGTLSGVETANFGGAVFSALTFTGTYTVNVPGCTGSLSRTLSNGVNAADDFVIVNGGTEIEFVSSSPGLAEQGVMKSE